MKITTLDKTAATLLKEYLFIPRFQRPYSWDREQVDQFWRDTIPDNEGDYFIGSVVLYKEKDAFGIVDGQQRITTIMLLLCALRDAFDSAKLPNLAAGLQGLIERPDVRDSSKRFVLLTDTSFPYLQAKILSRTKPDLEPEAGDEELKLQETFDFFRKRLDEALSSWPTKPAKGETKAAAILKEIRERILSLNLITVELDNEDDAYTIFETLNTRGKDLDNSHLLKNLLTKLLRPSNQSLDPVKLKWAQLMETFESSQADIDVDEFLHHYWLSRQKYAPSKKMFKEMKKDITTKADASNTLRELIADAPLYRAMIEPGFRKWTKEERTIRRSLHALSVFRVKQPFPLVLSTLRAYAASAISKKNSEAILLAIERFHFAVTAVTSQTSSGGVSLMYAAWARTLASANTEPLKQKAIKAITKGLSSKRPTEAEFVAAFQALRYSDKVTKQKKLVQYILQTFAEHFSDSGVATDHDQMTIEHIASQNPTTPGAVSPEHVAMMGNLLWCDTKIQEKLKNHSFAEKREILKNSKVAGKDAVVAKRTWGNKEIEERTLSLAKLAYNDIWP